MTSLVHFLNALGGLHDAHVVSIDWQIEAKTLEFTFDDLYANFLGLPEYPGRQKGKIILRGVSQVEIDVQSDQQRLRVFEFLPVDGKADVIVATFSPSGRVTAQFVAAEHPLNELRSLS